MNEVRPVFPSLRSCCPTAPGTGHMQGCSETGEYTSAPRPVPQGKAYTVTIPLDTPGAQENAAIALGLPANWLPILAEKDAEIARLRHDLADRDATIARLTAELDDLRDARVELVTSPAALEAAMTADPGREDGEVLRETYGERRAFAWRAAAREWEQVT